MTYRVDVSREGKFWVAEVEGVPGGATEVQRLADLEGELRDLLAGLLDQDEDSLDLSFDFRSALGDDGAVAWEAFIAERDELDALQLRVDSDRQEVLKNLHAKGVSMRDMATLVGLSHQRVSQLLEA